LEERRVRQRLSQAVQGSEHWQEARKVRPLALAARAYTHSTAVPPDVTSSTVLAQQAPFLAELLWARVLAAPQRERRVLGLAPSPVPEPPIFIPGHAVLADVISIWRTTKNGRRKPMAYDEEEAKKSRVVVETPAARREVVETQAVRRPERSGISGTAIAALVVGTVALITVVVLLLMSQQQDTANANLAAQPPQTTIVEQQPAQQPPVIIQQPAPVTQPAPIIVNPPSSSSGGATVGGGPDDTSIQAEIDKKIADDPTFSTMGITATVINGKVTLFGTVRSEALKLQIQRMVKAVKGVKEVDNQITVSG
jgi:BON domain-containing protein